MSETPERELWQRAAAILDELLDAPEAERSELLARRCGADAVLRAEVDALLAAAGGVGPLDGPPALARLAAAAADDGGQRAVGVAPGTAIGPYRVAAELGRGGMGVVLLAERSDGEYQRRVALKLIKRGLDSDEVVARFRRERQILARLDHPNIAHLLDGGVSDDGRPWFAMELVEGAPITSWADDRTASVDERLRLIIAACEAVGFAHRNLVVHRDLKPSNMLVTADGQLKLLDFGIAKLLGAELQGESTLLGPRPLTPEYAAPEQLAGDAVTTAADVWALGVVLHELLIGVRPDLVRGALRPPSRSGLRAVDAATAARRGTTCERLTRRLAGDLDAIVLKALEPDPARRYPTAEALADDLRRHLDGRPVGARRQTAIYRATRFVARHRLAVIAAVLIVASLAAGLAVALWQARRATRQAAITAAVQDFLIGIFEVSDPSESGGETITARELLDRGAARLAGELRDEPAVRAELALVIGDLYRRLGLYEQAATLLAQAVERTRAVLGEDSTAHAEALAAQGLLLWQQGRLQDALATQRRALELRRRLLGGDDPKVAESLSAVAVVLSDLGDDAGAEQAHREALAIDRAAFGEASSQAATDLDNLGVALRNQDRFEDAEPLLRSSLAIRRERLGDDHPDTLTAMQDLAVLLTDGACYAEAEQLLTAVLAGRRRVLGPEHPDVAWALDNLERVYERTARWPQAIAADAEALAIRRRVLGDEHPDTARSLNNHAVLCYRLGDLECAARGFADVIPVWQRTVGDDSEGVATATNNLGVVELERGHYDAAQRLLDAALTRRRQLAGESSQPVNQTLDALGRLALARGDPAAAAYLDGAAAMAAEVYPAGHPRVADVATSVAWLRLTQDRPAEALAAIDRALAIRRAAFGPDDQRVAEVRIQRAAALVKLNRAAEACPDLTGAVDQLATAPRLALATRHAAALLAASHGPCAAPATALLQAHSGVMSRPMTE